MSLFTQCLQAPLILRIKNITSFPCFSVNCFLMGEGLDQQVLRPLAGTSSECLGPGWRSAGSFLGAGQTCSLQSRSTQVRPAVGWDTKIIISPEHAVGGGQRGWEDVVTLRERKVRWNGDPEPLLTAPFLPTQSLHPSPSLKGTALT